MYMYICNIDIYIYIYISILVAKVTPFGKQPTLLALAPQGLCKSRPVAVEGAFNFLQKALARNYPRIQIWD